MLIIDETMYMASYLHDGTNENFQVASTNLHGNDAITWSSPSGQPDGSGSWEFASVTMASDGTKLYYALFSMTSDNTESLYFASSNLDGSGYTITSPQTAPDGMEQYPSHIDMVLVGNKIYGLVYSNPGGVSLLHRS